MDTLARPQLSASGAEGCSEEHLFGERKNRALEPIG